MKPIVIVRKFSGKARVFWFCAGFAALCAFLGLSALGPADIRWWDGVVEGLWRLCVVAAIGALLRALFRRHEKWTLDGAAIQHVYRDAFGERAREWPMSSVAGVRVNIIDGESFADQHSIIIKLASGKRLKLPAYRGETRAQEVAAQIEAWAGR